MNHYQTTHSAHSAHNGKYYHYETGVITGRHRDMKAIIADEAGFDGMGVQTHVGGLDDAWCVINLFDGLHRYIDSVAINGAMDEDHAVSLALGQFADLEPSYATVVANDKDGFDGMMWRSTAIHRVLSDDRQNTHYLPIINQKQLLEAQNRTTAETAMWDGVNVVSHGGSVSHLFLDIQKHDTYHELTTPYDLKADLEGASEIAFDAVVTTYNRLDTFKDRLFAAMAKIPQDNLKISNVTQGKMVKRLGAAQLPIVFELSDGQSMTIWFHNPDATPDKVSGNDTIVSWKWLLNSRDVTAAVSPAQGENLNFGTLAKRMMMLAAKNSKRFAAAQKRKGENQAKLQTAQDAVDSKLAMLADLDAQIEQLQQAIDEATRLSINATPTPKEVLVDVDNEVVGADGTPDERLNAKVENPVIHNPQEAVGQDEPDDEPVVLTGDEFGEFDLSNASDIKALREAAIAHLEAMRDEWVDVPALKIKEQDVKVQLRQRGIEHIRAYSPNPEKLLLLKNIKQLLKTSKYLYTNNNAKTVKKPNVALYHYLINQFVWQGNKTTCVIVIEKDDKGLLHYDVVMGKYAQKHFDIVKEKMVGYYTPENNLGNSQPSDDNSTAMDSISQDNNNLDQEKAELLLATSQGLFGFDGYSTDFDNESQDDFDGLCDDGSNANQARPFNGLDMKNAEWVSANKSDLIQHWLNDNVNFAPCQDIILDNLDDDVMLDSLKSGYVLNLFIFDKDGNEIKDEPTDNQETTTDNQAGEPQILGATLEWTEANFDENLKFDSLEALQAWFNKTYTKEFFKEDGSPYFKNKLTIDFNSDDSVTMRIDVNSRTNDLKGDYNPLKFSLAEWLEANYQSFSKRGLVKANQGINTEQTDPNLSYLSDMANGKIPLSVENMQEHIGKIKEIAIALDGKHDDLLNQAIEVYQQFALSVKVQ